MRSILLQRVNQSYRALNKVASPAQRKQIEFIRNAVKDAIRREEYRKIRRAYKAQPDSSADSDSWSNPEEFAI
jgi:hypothetical protein